MLVHREGKFAQDFSISTSLQIDRARPKMRRQALDELRAVRDALQTGNELR
jgi:hypothetical protein